jgi:hypothetical protein
MITVIHPDGRIDHLDERKPSLERLQELVGGYIELVPLVLHKLTGKHVVVNEDGIPLDLPFNKAASEKFGMPLVGTVVITELDDIE